PPLPVTATCPPATCSCRPMPADLDIDHKTVMGNSVAPYSEHVLVSTGRSDWPSRIEDDESTPVVAALKGAFGRGGKYTDPFHNVLTSTSSLKPTDSTADTSSVLLFPSFQYFPRIENTSPAMEALVKGYLLPTTLHKHHDVLSPEQKAGLTRDESFRSELDVKPVQDVTVLICGHGARDNRCGVLGPLLQAEFEDKLAMAGFDVRQDPPGSAPENGQSSSRPETALTARVGLISHIGGHKFAGNVIIYMPNSSSSHGLSGKGIWYGRVEPKHVEGIIKETIQEGRVIKELFRGGIGRHSEPLRL
ncbi:Sucraseferredoxin-like protein, partial [Eremomyces bilateralis CBS 781.70]